MSRSLIIALAYLAASCAHGPDGADAVGPARFCGYSPIIDLLPGERIRILEGGIHGGSFRWEGSFGRLEVTGIGWASRPPGQALQTRTTRGHQRFEQRHEEGRYRVAIWNGAQGAAYFSSSAPLTPAQLEAIERVDLYQEGQEPQGCNHHTVFSWG